MIVQMICRRRKSASIPSERFAYGFGFQIGRPDEARTYGHGGGAPGMNAILRVYPESGQSVIVLCNLDSPSASRMGDWLHARMPLK